MAFMPCRAVRIFLKETVNENKQQQSTAHNDNEHDNLQENIEYLI